MSSLFTVEPHAASWDVFLPMASKSIFIAVVNNRLFSTVSPSLSVYLSSSSHIQPPPPLSSLSFSSLTIRSINSQVQLLQPPVSSSLKVLICLQPPSLSFHSFLTLSLFSRLLSVSLSVLKCWVSLAHTQLPFRRLEQGCLLNAFITRQPNDT